MKLKREEIARLSRQMVENLREKSLAEFLAPEDKLREAVEIVIQKNMDQEMVIEDEARKIMDQYKSQIASGTIDSQKAYTMIKKQIAKDKKFVL
jgi:hypothetical protein